MSGAGSRSDMKVIEASRNPSVKELCNKILKLIDTKVNKGVKNKINQIKSLEEFGEKSNVDPEKLRELSYKLDALINSIIKLEA